MDEQFENIRSPVANRMGDGCTSSMWELTLARLKNNSTELRHTGITMTKQFRLQIVMIGYA